MHYLDEGSEDWIHFWAFVFAIHASNVKERQYDNQQTALSRGVDLGVAMC